MRQTVSVHCASSELDELFNSRLLPMSLMSDREDIQSIDSRRPVKSEPHPCIDIISYYHIASGAFNGGPSRPAARPEAARSTGGSCEMVGAHRTGDLGRRPPQPLGDGRYQSKHQRSSSSSSSSAQHGAGLAHRRVLFQSFMAIRI